MTRSQSLKIWRSLLGLAVVAGVLSSMLLIGLAINLLSLSLGRFLTLVTPAVATILVIMGMLMIFGVNPLQRSIHFNIMITKNPLITAFAYGTLYGPISIPCIAPLLLSVFASSFLLTETVSRLLFFLVFGLGLSLPLFIIAVLSDTVGDSYVKFVTIHHRKLMVGAGFLLVAVAVYSYITFFTYGIFFV